MNILLAPFALARTVERKVLMLLAFLVLLVGGYLLVRARVHAYVQIDGPVYHRIELQHALNADVVAPRLYAQRSYFNAMALIESVLQGDEASRRDLLERHQRLGNEYRDSARFWRARGPEELGDTLTAVLETGEQLLDFLDHEVVAAIVRRDIALARQELHGEGAELYALHSAAVADLRTATTGLIERTTARAQATAERWQGLVDAAGVVGIGLFTWILLVGLRELVLQPVDRVRKHFETIGGGDYSTPVLTRRTDEFGEMLRGLERMRVNLASAITARDAAAAALSLAERKHREIVENSVQGFYQSSPEGRFLAANKALAAMLGYPTVEELLAQPAGTAERLYVDASRRTEFVRLMGSHGFVSGFEAALRRRDGRVIWVSEAARLVDGDQGQYCEGFLDDITARKEAEQLKSDFVSFVTHQLRTPLAGIRWMLELSRQSSLDPDAESFLEDAHASAERLIALVNDLLDIARLESARLVSTAEPTAIDRLAGELLDELQPLAAARDQTITVAGDSVPPVMVDPQLARQALLNLLSNALKYTPQGGRITVRTIREGDHVRWSVQDTGIGIPAVAQSKLFEKFYRADNAQVVDTEGTGLGLYLVRLIAERAGGAVAYESQEGIGSTFSFTLPVAGQQQAVA